VPAAPSARRSCALVFPLLSASLFGLHHIREGLCGPDLGAPLRPCPGPVHTECRPSVACPHPRLCPRSSPRWWNGGRAVALWPPIRRGGRDKTILWVPDYRWWWELFGGGGRGRRGQLIVFVSSIDELYLLVTVEASFIFRSRFGSSVGGDFCDAQCHGTTILSLDSSLSPLLEITLVQNTRKYLFKWRLSTKWQLISVHKMQMRGGKPIN
jgi:hypothetical protein